MCTNHCSSLQLMGLSQWDHFATWQLQECITHRSLPFHLLLVLTYPHAMVHTSQKFPYGEGTFSFHSTAALRLCTVSVGNGKANNLAFSLQMLQISFRHCPFLEILIHLEVQKWKGGIHSKAGFGMHTMISCVYVLKCKCTSQTFITVHHYCPFLYNEPLLHNFFLVHIFNKEM